MQTSKFRTKLQNSISASKLLFDNYQSENGSYQIRKQNTNGFIYHMESFYRDNANDKYELSGRTISQNTKDIDS